MREPALTDARHPVRATCSPASSARHGRARASPRNRSAGRLEARDPSARAADTIYLLAQGRSFRWRSISTTRFAASISAPPYRRGRGTARLQAGVAPRGATRASCDQLSDYSADVVPRRGRSGTRPFRDRDHGCAAQSARGQRLDRVRAATKTKQRVLPRWVAPLCLAQSSSWRSATRSPANGAG